MDPTIQTDSPFVYLSFLAAPALLTNASTLLALGTSNRLARAADRARAAAAAIVAARNPEDPLVRLQQQEFAAASRRAQLLIVSLRRTYLAAGCFAAGTCIALIGAFANYLGFHAIDTVTQVSTVVFAITGVGGLVHGSITLLYETQIALRVLEHQEEAIRAWQSTHAEAKSGGATSAAVAATAEIATPLGSAAVPGSAVPPPPGM